MPSGQDSQTISEEDGVAIFTLSDGPHSFTFYSGTWGSLTLEMKISSQWVPVTEKIDGVDTAVVIEANRTAVLEGNCQYRMTATEWAANIVIEMARNVAP